MISKLRRRIVAINVITAGLILLVAVILIFSLGYGRINAEREKRLNTALSYNPEEDMPFEKNEILSELALAIYNINEHRVEQWFFGPDCHLRPETVENELDEILASNRESGMVQLHIRYVKEQQGDTVRIVFNNLAERTNSLLPYMLTSLLTIFLGLSCFMFLSIILANIALKPVEESWTKQKQFVADASHELKTPISVIMANTDMLVSHKDETVESQMQWVQNTQEESRRMADLVADLLFLAKNDDGVQVQKEFVNLSDCVSSAVLGHEVLFYENGKTFTYEIAADIRLEGNDGQLKQLVGILLDNANKYSKGEGNVRLELFATAKHILLSVSNDCENISDEQLVHLFDRFYTLDPSRNKHNGGNGLGLAIAKTICETHLGSIRADYENGRITFLAMFPVKRHK